MKSHDTHRELAQRQPAAAPPQRTEARIPGAEGARYPDGRAASMASFANSPHILAQRRTMQALLDSAPAGRASSAGGSDAHVDKGSAEAPPSHAGAGIAQLQRDKGRRARKRTAKALRKERHQPKRDSVRLRAPNPKAEEFFKKNKAAKLERARKLGATRPPLSLGYGHYPQGSYGHGRHLYATKALTELGATKQGLVDFDKADIEVDHSPHDGSQRKGARVDDEPSRYRVAVPLPRAWHRRHKTTHGADATRHDQTFCDEQKDLVKNNKYPQALERHLLETFSDEAIASTGVKKVSAVAKHALHALAYASSTNVAEKVHDHHKAKQPLITAPQAAATKQALHARLEAWKASKNKGVWPNPFA
jgi:hypothetical protein